MNRATQREAERHHLRCPPHPQTASVAPRVPALVRHDATSHITPPPVPADGRQAQDEGPAP